MLSGYHIKTHDPLGGPKRLMDMEDGDCAFINRGSLLFDGLELWVDGRRYVYPRDEGELESGQVQVWKTDGIWYCEPFKDLLWTGTPMTGNGEMAATMPGRCAAPPAPAIITS